MTTKDSTKTLHKAPCPHPECDGTLNIRADEGERFTTLCACHACRVEVEVSGGECRVREVGADRDALAAHVERWNEWMGRGPEEGDGEWIDDGWVIARETPEVSLARIKAQWQAEELQFVLDDSYGIDCYGTNVWDVLRARIDVLRREAEGKAP